MIHLMLSIEVITEKSGWVMAVSMLPGSWTRYLGLIWYLVSGPGVEVGVGDVEHKGEGSGDKQHEHGAWNGLDEFVFDEETAKEER